MPLQNKTPVLSSTSHKKRVRKLALSVFSHDEHRTSNSYEVALTGIEPATLQSLARRSNQLSFAAAKQIFIDIGTSV